MNYTNEQLLYINYDGPEHTKLLACAGSGKTRCIISRMNNLIKKNIYKPSQLLMLTFSRFTRDDFIKKINQEKDSQIDLSSIKTIDSFAKYLIDEENKIDVSLLSFKFMKYLQDSSIEELVKNEKLSKIKIIFVDESQDLNEIQYNIFTSLKNKLKININLIGDPNQNIFQFRKSSEKYLSNFDSKIFKLTHNFRSKKPIIEFSKYLRPFTDLDIVCTQGDNNKLPIMTMTKTDFYFATNLIEFINLYKNNLGADLSEIAILAPTRGRMTGSGKSYGLCLISNILYKNKIKFKQFYEESNEEFGGNIQYKPKKGYINVLTYMGSKGLEWKYVIVVDADTCLINKRYFDEQKNLNDRYLLYVACSRAIDHMIIFSKYDDKHSKTNIWFKLIPEENYIIDDIVKDKFKFKELEYFNYGTSEYRITKIIDQFDEYTLDNLSKLINYENKKIIKKKIIFKKKYKHLDNTVATFLGKYVELYFNSLYRIKFNLEKKPFTDLENIIDSIIDKRYIISNVPNYISDWFYNNKNYLTWDNFDKDDSIDDKIRNIVNRRFERTKELNEYTIINDDYYLEYILSKQLWIRSVYEKYMDCEDSEKLKKYVFDILIILHSIETQHYFHIQNKGKKFTKILTLYNELFEEIKNFANKIPFELKDHNIPICGSNIEINENKLKLRGEIDILDTKNNIWEIKCTGELTLKHFLQVLMYNIIYHNLINEDKKVIIKLNFINLLVGEINKYKIKLSKKKIIKIINIFLQN